MKRSKKLIKDIQEIEAPPELDQSVLDYLFNQQGEVNYKEMEGYTPRVKKLLESPEITRDAYKYWTAEEYYCINAYFFYGQFKLTGAAQTKWKYQIRGVAPDLMDEILEECREILIPEAIDKTVRSCLAFPYLNNISESTGIPHSEVRGYIDSIPDDSGKKYMKGFKALESRVMASVYKSAMDGDMTAAKLFLTVTGAIEQTPRTQTVHNTQNNFIQLNGNILSQHTIEQLPEAQQVQVWELINSSLPQKQLSKPKPINGTNNKERSNY